LRNNSRQISHIDLKARNTRKTRTTRNSRAPWNKPAGIHASRSIQPQRI